jgi:outer membrane protein
MSRIMCDDRIAACVGGLLLVGLLATGAVCENGKVGYISSGRIFREYAGASDVTRQYDKDLSEWQGQALEMKKEIDNLSQELQDQELMLSEDAKQKKRDELAQKRSDYQKFIEEIWGPDGKAAKRELELTKPLVTKIDKILERIALEEEFDIILDMDESAILYAKEGLDLTDRIIDELNMEIAPVAEIGEKARLVVFRFRETTPEAMEGGFGRNISDLLETALIQLGKFERWEGNLGAALLQEGIDKEDDVDEKRAVDVSRIAGDDVAVIGTVSKLGSEVTVEVKMIDVRSGMVMATEAEKTARSETQEDLLPLVGSLASRLFQEYTPE